YVPRETPSPDALLAQPQVRCSASRNGNSAPIPIPIRRRRIFTGEKQCSTRNPPHGGRQIFITNASRGHPIKATFDLFYSFRQHAPVWQFSRTFPKKHGFSLVRLNQRHFKIRAHHCYRNSRKAWPRADIGNPLRSGRQVSRKKKRLKIVPLYCLGLISD